MSNSPKPRASRAAFGMASAGAMVALMTAVGMTCFPSNRPSPSCAMTQRDMSSRFEFIEPAGPTPSASL